MSLSDTRRYMRYQSLTTAATMIADQLQIDVDPEDIGMSDEEYELYALENIRTHDVLMKMAEKLYENHEKPVEEDFEIS